LGQMEVDYRPVVDSRCVGGPGWFGSGYVGVRLEDYTMKLRDLKDILNEYPDDVEVVIWLPKESVFGASAEFTIEADLPENLRLVPVDL